MAATVYERDNCIGEGSHEVLLNATLTPKCIKKPTTSHGFTSLSCLRVVVRRRDKGTCNSRRPLRGSEADDEVACDHRRISGRRCSPSEFFGNTFAVAG